MKSYFLPFSNINRHGSSELRVTLTPFLSPSLKRLLLFPALSLTGRIIHHCCLNSSVTLWLVTRLGQTSLYHILIQIDVRVCFCICTYTDEGMFVHALNTVHHSVSSSLSNPGLQCILLSQDPGRSTDLVVYLSDKMFSPSWQGKGDADNSS